MIRRAYRPRTSPSHSSPGSASFNDAMSHTGSLRSQHGFLASLAQQIGNPFASALGSHPGVSSSVDTNDNTTVGRGGSQSSTTYAFPINLSEVAVPVAVTAPTAIVFGSQTQTMTYTVPQTTQNDGDEHNDDRPNSHNPWASPPQGGSPNSPPPQGGAGGGGGATAVVMDLPPMVGITTGPHQGASPAPGTARRTTTTR